MYNELCNARSGFARIKGKNGERKKLILLEKEQKRVNEIKVRSIKFKPFQAPTYGGNIKEYPSFKKDYNSYMTKIYGKDALALKNCLSDEALKHVHAVDDDYDEIVKRLDLKYGRPEKLVDLVLNELEGLQRVEENDNGMFIQMVDMIERNYLDLMKVKLG